MSATAFSTYCPECAGSVELARQPLQGEVIRCACCSAELEVLAVQPLQIALAPQVEEDWGE